MASIHFVRPKKRRPFQPVEDEALISPAVQTTEKPATKKKKKVSGGKPPASKKKKRKQKQLVVKPPTPPPVVRPPPASGLFDALPDSLIVNILLFTTGAEDIVRLGSTCKRLRQLADSVPHLHFIGGKGQSRGPAPFELLVSERVARSTDLRCLKVETRWSISDLSFFCWVDRAKEKLQKLHLIEGRLDDNLERRLRIASKCPNLVALEFVATVDDTYVNLEAGFQSGVTPFRKLLKLTLEHVMMSDPVLNELLALCPLLKELDLTGVSGLQAPIIKSEKLERLKLLRNDPANEQQGLLTLDAPALQGLALSRFSELKFVGESTGLYDLELLDCEKLSIVGDSSLFNVQFLMIRTTVYRLPFPAWSWERLCDTLLKKCPNIWELTLDTEIEPPQTGDCPWGVFAGLAELHELVVRETFVEFVGFHWEAAGERKHALLPSLRGFAVCAETMSHKLIHFLGGVLAAARELEELTIKAEWPERLEVDTTIEPRFMTRLLALQKTYRKVTFKFEMPGANQGNDMEESGNSIPD